ncbi:MAG: FAD-dependent oxidoreductase [Myxococcales bacterium]|nr:FAD-dependent oxidoreductase [Myxococcales bacterium]
MVDELSGDGRARTRVVVAVAVVISFLAACGSPAPAAPQFPGRVGPPADCATLSGYDTIIVGAGIAGLAAARELQRFGQKVVILEASDHVGGRGFTYTMGAGTKKALPIDLGGAWVHAVETNPLTGVVDAMGLTRIRSVLDEPYYVGNVRASDADVAAWWEEEEKFEEALAKAGKRVRAGETPAAFCESALGDDEVARISFCNALYDRTGAAPTAASCAAGLRLYCSAAVRTALDGAPADKCSTTWPTLRAPVTSAAGADADAKAWLTDDGWKALGLASCDFVEGRARDRASYYLPLEGPLRGFMEQNLGPLDSAGELRETSAVDIGEFAAGEDDLVPEGMGTFVRRYGANAPVCLKSPVTRVTHDASGVAIQVSDGRTYKGNAALVTVSTGVLSHTDAQGNFTFGFAPPLSAEKRDAIKRMPMGAMQKIIMRFKRDIFTGARENSWVLYRDVTTGAIMAFVIKPFGTNTAIGFFGGEKARTFEAACKAVGYDPNHPEAQPCDAPAVTEAKISLARMYSVTDLDAALDGPVYVTRWTQYPWTRGAYAVVTPGSVQMREVLAAPVHGGDDPKAPHRLYFAGDATARSIYSGSFAGSYESGLTAARRIISGE